MKRSFVLTQSAARDIDRILQYVLDDSGPSRALRVHARLYEALSKIAVQPNLVGHVRHDLADESLRVLAVFSYLVIYRPDTRPVQILRVIHGARDLRAAFDA